MHGRPTTTLNGGFSYRKGVTDNTTAPTLTVQFKPKPGDNLARENATTFLRHLYHGAVGTSTPKVNSSKIRSEEKLTCFVQPQAFKLDLGSGEVYILPPSDNDDIKALKTRLMVKRAPDVAPHTPTGASSAQAAAQPLSADQLKIRDLEKQLTSASKREADAKAELKAATAQNASARRLSTVGQGASDRAVMHPSKLKQDGIAAHKWPLGGLAELIHNAADAGAKDLSIDVISLPKKTDDGNSEEVRCICFADNGRGMDTRRMDFMLQMGHDVKAVDDQCGIGRFGVGLKTGSMRCAKDVVILSRFRCGAKMRNDEVQLCGPCRDAWDAPASREGWQPCEKTTGSVCAISQTFLLDGKEVRYPRLTWDLEEGLPARGQEENLELFRNFQEKLKMFNDFKVSSLLSEMGTADHPFGTKIYLFNLEKNGAGQPLLDLDSDPKDIRMPEQPDGAQYNNENQFRGNGHYIAADVPLDYSLRAYCEVMFLK